MATIMIKIMANIRKEIEIQLMSGMPAYISRARSRVIITIVWGLSSFKTYRIINVIHGAVHHHLYITSARAPQFHPRWYLLLPVCQLGLR